MLNQAFTSRTNTPSQSEIFHSGPAHPPKEKYSLSEPKSVPKLIIRHTGDTAYDSYIAETLIPLRSAFKPRKQTRFESDPMTSVRHIPARCRSQTPTSGWTMDPLDTDLLIPIELSRASMGDCVQDLRESEAGEAYDTSIAHTPPSQPCGQFQAQRSDNSRDSIAHCRTDTPSQREIFSGATHNNTFRTATPSQSEIKPLTITVSGPTHPPKVKYSLKLQMLHIPVTQRQVRVQTFVRSSPHPPRPAARQPAVPTAQRLPGPPHPPKVKYSQKQQQSMMRAVRQVQERLPGPPPQSLAI